MTEASQVVDKTPSRLSSDSTAQRVARVYAEALYSEAEKQNAVQSVIEELEFLIFEVVPQDPVVRNFFLGGVVGRKSRDIVLKKVFEGKLSELALHFILVLSDHERLELIRPVLSVYRTLLEERSGQVRVLVWSAVPLPEDQKERLIEQMKTLTKRQPVLIPKVDPDMLGGLIVQVGDWRYDASVRHQLDIIRTQLIESSSHEIQAGRDRFSSAE